jgi:hypothetical protein
MAANGEEVVLDSTFCSDPGNNQISLLNSPGSELQLGTSGDVSPFLRNILDSPSFSLSFTIVPGAGGIIGADSNRDYAVPFNWRSMSVRLWDSGKVNLWLDNQEDWGMCRQETRCGADCSGCYTCTNCATIEPYIPGGWEEGVPVFLQFQRENDKLRTFIGDVMWEYTIADPAFAFETDNGVVVTDPSNVLSLLGLSGGQLLDGSLSDLRFNSGMYIYIYTTHVENISVA